MFIAGAIMLGIGLLIFCICWGIRDYLRNRQPFPTTVTSVLGCAGMAIWFLLTVAGLGLMNLPGE